MKRAAATTFGCAAVLLSYPDATFADDLTSVRAALSSLPVGARSRIAGVVEWLSAMSAMEAAAGYVETFDLRRGTSLFLTYYRHGDTRERGLALTALVDAYRAAGFGLASGELPDFLPALLELAACHSAGAAMLCEHRMALDALRLGLEDAHSGYTPVVATVIDALPRPSRADRTALERYRAQGPPSERVGLEPFAPPEVLGQGVTRR
jgi:nitrate reductase delta subunit